MVLFDEMYIQKGTQFHGEKKTGADEDGNFNLLKRLFL